MGPFTSLVGGGSLEEASAASRRSRSRADRWIRKSLGSVMKGGSEGRAGDRSRPRCAKGRPEGQAVDRSRPKDVDVERRARAGRPTVSLMSAEYAFPGRRPIGAIRGFRPTAASRDPTAIASRQPTPPLTSHGFGDDLFGRGAPCGDGGRLPGGQKHTLTFDLPTSLSTLARRCTRRPKFTAR